MGLLLLKLSGIVFTLLGIKYVPKFTIGCLLMHYGHPILGGIAICISLFEEDDEIEYTD